MALQRILQNKKFLRIYLILTICLSGITIVFDIVGFLNVVVIQWIAAILMMAIFFVLLFLAILLYIDANNKNPIGRRIRILNQVLIILIAIIPLLISLIGMLASSGLYFILSVSTNASIIGQILTIALFMLLLGYAILLSIFCFLKINEKSVWTF